MFNSIVGRLISNLDTFPLIFKFGAYQNDFADSLLEPNHEHFVKRDAYDYETIESAHIKLIYMMFNKLKKIGSSYFLQIT